MALLTTDAIVLHAFDYLETSRIYRIVTREAGVQSVLARGARRSKSRFGSAVDLFAEGEAQLSMRPSRELQTLTAFDVTRSRPSLAQDLGRFTGAAAIAELALRFMRDDANPALYDVVRTGLDRIAAADDPRCATLAVAWHLIAELGFSPAIDRCSVCHVEVPSDGPAAFSHPAGGTLCPSCAGAHGRVRSLPASARSALGAWVRGNPHTLSSDSAARAHQRLLREFVHEHLADNVPFRAFDVWERGNWSRAVGAASHRPDPTPHAAVP
jgi:DNA repair protein RecO (recombination protein O)